jgi:hypothetical protein
MYIPSFTEVFVGLIVVALWSRWLEPRVALARWAPWIAGLAAAIGVLVGAWGVSLEQAELVLYARWGAAGVCVLTLVMLAAWTAMSWGQPVSDPASDPSDEPS